MNELTQEIWREVEGYNGDYYVSNYARVISYKGRKGKPRFCKVTTIKAGYQKLTLSLDGKKKQHYLHRLVAHAFCPKPEGKVEVNHIDHVRNNNLASNLEWLSHKDNVAKSFSRGERKQGGAPSGTKGRKVMNIRTGETYVSLTVAAQMTGQDLCTVSRHCRNKVKYPRWTYVD